MIKRLLFAIFIIYVILLGLLYFFQRDIMYHPKRYNSASAGLALKEFTMIPLKAADGAKVYGWLHVSNANNPMVIYFHGNAETVPETSHILRQFTQAGYNVFAMEYRGYGLSDLYPSEEGIYADARAAVNYAMTRTPANKIILFGRSLGTGVAVKMATEYQVGGVVLQSPYTAMEDVAQPLYPYFPIKKLGMMKDNYNSLAIAKLVNEPVLIVQGGMDNLTPFSGAKQLADALVYARFDSLIFPNADHVNGYDTGKIIEKMDQFFKMKAR